MSAPLSQDEAVRLGRIDPAASAYAAHQRDPGAIRREAERIRALMDACRQPPVTPVLVTTPADEVAADAVDLRRLALAMR